MYGFFNFINFKAFLIFLKFRLEILLPFFFLFGFFEFPAFAIQIQIPLLASERKSFRQVIV